VNLKRALLCGKLQYIPTNKIPGEATGGDIKIFYIMRLPYNYKRELKTLRKEERATTKDRGSFFFF
jgi:hypothetical protein